MRGPFRPKVCGWRLFATRLYGKSEAGAGVWASRTAAAGSAGERRRVPVLLRDGGGGEGARFAALLEMGPLQWRRRGLGEAGARPVGCGWCPNLAGPDLIAMVGRKMMENSM